MGIQAEKIIEFMNRLAPPDLAESWDNPGLQVGTGKQMIRKVLVSLDVTRENIEYAVRNSYNMILTHHPLLFRGIKKVDMESRTGSLIAALCIHRICAFAAHTNLDSADGGVNDVLAEKLLLKDCTGFIPVKEEKLYKFTIYVPESHADPVREAMRAAGAGYIGGYSGCSFSVRGEGRFLPEEGTHPFIGTVHKPEMVQEMRIETILPSAILPQVLSAVLKVHPYEEPAYDIYPLANKGRTQSMGRIGWLPEPMEAVDAVRYVKGKLGIPCIRCSGRVKGIVQKTAVLGGAGAEFMDQAAAVGADIYITGDIKYHEAQEAEAQNILLIDGGHFYTEQLIVPHLVSCLRREAEQQGWDIQIDEDRNRHDSFKYL